MGKRLLLLLILGVLSLVSISAQQAPENERDDLNRRTMALDLRTATYFELVAWCERLGLQPIVLHEQANQGRTIIEKFEGHADVDFAIVLLTTDDIGYLRNRPEEMKPRARQNVIFELGYFVGRLGRARVCALYQNGVEIPSDYHGVLYVPMDPHGAWKRQLAKELRAVGFNVNSSTLLE